MQHIQFWIILHLHLGSGRILKLVTFIFFVSLCQQIAAQTQSKSTKIEIGVHQYTDRADYDVREIIELYRKYVNSRPDSIQPNNPYWCSEDKKRYSDFDFTRRLYQYNTNYLGKGNAHDFEIIQIKKDKDAYLIDIAVVGNNLRSYYSEYSTFKNVNPILSIIRLYAVREMPRWKLKNAFDFITNNWQVVNDKNITYHYSCPISTNNIEIERNRKFSDSVAKILNIKMQPYFHLYIAPNPEEMHRLTGFSYVNTTMRFSSGYTFDIDGMVFQDNILLKGNGSASYPYGLVKMMLSEKKIKSSMISDGISYWLGGSKLNNVSFEKGMKRVVYSIQSGDGSTLRELWNAGKYDVSEFNNAFLCKLVYEKQGIAGLEQLYSIENYDHISFYNKVRKILQVEDLDSYWREQVMKYKD